MTGSRLTREERMRGSILFLAIAILPFLGGCQKESGSDRPALPPATAGLELQSADYAEARGEFQTRLLKSRPAPTTAGAVRPPHGVSEATYRSGDLALKAWVWAPDDSGNEKHPAVVFLHGGWAFDTDDWEAARPFRDAGFAVMAPMLRGENGQPGTFSMFYDEVADVIDAADFFALQPFVDPTHLFVAGRGTGGTLAMLSALACNRFRAAASFSGSPDQVLFAQQPGMQELVPFDTADIREFRLRSPVAYATSFKCPARLYHGSRESSLEAPTQRTALLAREKGLDVEAVAVPGDDRAALLTAVKQAIEFFKQK